MPKADTDEISRDPVELKFIFQRTSQDDRKVFELWSPNLDTVERVTTLIGQSQFQRRDATRCRSGRLSRLVPSVLRALREATEGAERKRAEESLREREAYLAEAQKLSRTGSWAWVPATGKIRYWSEECKRVLGYDPHGGQPRFETFLNASMLMIKPRLGT